jgi:hypothetical protein
MSDSRNFDADGEFRDVQTIIRERVEMIAAVFSRKISEQMVVVFQDALQLYPKGAVKKAFAKAEQGLERFPTPKIMRDLCNAEMPSRGWAYHFLDGKDANGVACRLDPDPNCDYCREPRSLHPRKSCAGFAGSIYMYKPEDCEEGRAYLAKIQELQAEKRPKFIFEKPPAAVAEAVEEFEF